MRWFILYGVLAGCAEEAPATLAMGDDPLAPPLPTVVGGDATPGHDLEITVSGASAGLPVWLVWGALPGAGPCPAVLGGPCLGIQRPTLIGSTSADAAGAAVFRLPVPLGAPVGMSACFQGAVRVGGGVSAVTSVVDLVVQDPVDVCDRSGGAVASASCDLLGLINDTRAAGRTCGARGVFAPTHPFTMDARLRSAAEIHAGWMADTQTFSHASPNGPIGDTFTQRAVSQGYRWSSLSETIARGDATPAAVLRTWLASDPHCADLMDPGKRDIGIGGALAANGVWYWAATQGEPR